jgi:hypothetical protein
MLLTFATNLFCAHRVCALHLCCLDFCLRKYFNNVCGTAQAVIVYRSDGWVLIAGTGRNLSSHHCIESSSGATFPPVQEVPALSSDIKGHSIKLTTHLRPVLRLTMRDRTFLNSLCPLMLMESSNFTFVCLICCLAMYVIWF